MQYKFSEEIYQDIFIEHELKINLKNKIVVIHSDCSIEKDGKMDVLASKKYWYEHHHYFYKYMKNNYLEDFDIQNIVENYDKDYFKFLKICLNRYQDIIFLDVMTSESSWFDGAMLFIPSVISENQFETLEILDEYFSLYDSIWVLGGCEINDIYDNESFVLDENIDAKNFDLYLKSTLSQLINNGEKKSRK